MCIHQSRRDAHTFIQTMNKQINSIGFTIKYQHPYPSFGLEEEWRTQSFTTLEEAERMIEFYRSCRVCAMLIN